MHRVPEAQHCTTQLPTRIVLLMAMSPYPRRTLFRHTRAALISLHSRSARVPTSQPLRFSNLHFTMTEQLEAFCFKGPRVVIKKVPIPKPTSPDHLIIKVVVSGSNPKVHKLLNPKNFEDTYILKDWKIAERVEGHNQGDDIAGYVHEVWRS